MKTLYLACNMGAAGDMLSAALLELHPDPAGMVSRLNALGIPGVTYEAEPMDKCGIRGTHLTVRVRGEEEESHDVHGHAHSHDYDHEHDHDHAHTHVHDGAEHEHNHDHEQQDAAEHVHEHHHHHDEHDGHSHEHHHHHGHSHDDGHDQAHDHDHHHSHHHVHRNLADIRAIVDHLDIPESVRSDIMKVYQLIAEAESHAHGRPVEEVHFHEVGAMDAVADITAFCLLLHELAPDQVIASPVNVGFGEVQCAHGILPVPAPATAWILRGIPIYAGQIRGEMCTPTGAALLKCFAQSYGQLPQMCVDRIGIGCGKKDFEQANIVRAMLGETPDSRDSVLELTCNLDDMTPEAVGFAMEELLAAGAVDVYTVPVTMKKSRPGLMLTCMCRQPLRDRMLEILFRHTTTLGVREILCSRSTMDREERTLHTSVGDIRLKTSRGWGAVREKYEYEDLARAAREKGISLSEAAKAADESRRKEAAD